jgi:predicted GNAT family N-acyltransferase
MSRMGWILLCLLAVASALYWRLGLKGRISERVVISHYATVAQAPLSSKQYEDMLEVYHGCFEEAREKNLRNFLQSKSQQDSVWSNMNVEKRVSKALQDIRLDSLRTFKDRTDIYIGMLHDQVVGFFTCTDDHTLADNGVMIGSLCVDAKLRKKGVGSKLIQSAISSCKQEGRPLSLMVDSYRSNLISMYQHFGFVLRTPEHPFPDSFDYFDKVYMRYEPEASVVSDTSDSI